MFNSRSVSNELWVTAHKSLVFYFTRRRCKNAEDLAQNTLMTMWQREDFCFEKQEDFLKVCYGFARNILHQGFRDDKKHAAEELTPSMEPSSPKVEGLLLQELRILLDQVGKRAKADLSDEELALLIKVMQREGHEPPLSTKLRVKLHRIRKKLRKIIGLDQ
jgi:DNA-directed RNA polymerase specialized sigma24 family protein